MQNMLCARLLMHVREVHESQMTNAVVFDFESNSEGFQMKPISQNASRVRSWLRLWFYNRMRASHQQACDKCTLQIQWLHPSAILTNFWYASCLVTSWARRKYAKTMDIARSPESSPEADILVNRVQEVVANLSVPIVSSRICLSMWGAFTPRFDACSDVRVE